MTSNTQQDNSSTNGVVAAASSSTVDESTTATAALAVPYEPTAAAVALETAATTASYAATTIVDDDSSPLIEAAYAIDGYHHHQQAHDNNHHAVATSQATTSAVPVVAAAAASAIPSSTATALYATPYAAAAATAAASPSSNHFYGASQQQRQHDFEEEKEEIAGLAGIPSAGVANYAEPATVIRNGNDQDDEEELARLKRAAYYGHEDVNVVPDREPQPEPLPGEDFATFYARTIDHWNVLAAERLTGSGDDLTIDTLEDESTRMASQRWQEMQPAMNAEATVVAISEGDVHPADLGAIQAEWVRYGTPSGQPDDGGQHHDATPTSDVVAATATSAGTNGTAVATAVEDTTTEATVIDTAPLGKEEGRDAWQAAEQAQVLENVIQEVEQIDNDDEQDRKPAASSARITETPRQVVTSEYASDANNSQQQQQQQRGEYAVAEQEGLVLAIEDDVHPSAFTIGDANAQVVGADFGYAVTNGETAADGAPQASIAAATAVAEVASGEGTASTEVQAVLVESSSTFGAVTATPAVTDATLEESQTVAVLSTEDITVETDTEVDLDCPPTKDIPWSGPPAEAASSGTTIDGERDEACTPPPPPPPSQECFEHSNREQSAASGNSERSSSSQRSQLHNLSSNIVRSTGNVMDALFGDAKGPFVGKKTRASEIDIASSVVPRTLLPWSVIFSSANKMWVATIQTSQKALDSNDITEASKALRAFSLPTEKQAISLARAWTPPRMMAFRDSPACHICKSKFAVFRRACHCRNCGVCVCKDCAVQWPSNMVPDTYNTKDEACVNACKSCDWISNAFRLALLNGSIDEAIAIHATGNINVTCPFSNVKGELFYPVHCAVLGGNLQLLKWLVDEQCCPIKSVRVSGRSRESAGRYTPIVTSKGRSLLGIAMENCYVQIVRYLVVNKGIVIAGERDITHEMLSKNLTKILRALPDEAASPDETDEMLSPESADSATGVLPEDAATPVIPEPDDNIRSLSDGARDFGAIYQHRDVQSSATGEAADECIICFDGKIDCVATPCGHQICCLKCSNNVSRCPVCAQDCSFMRVFKP